MNLIEKARENDRKGLLETVKRELLSDPRVVAAWLHGSIGRGEHDSWSDLDLWIVLEDEALESTVKSRLVEVSKLGVPILIVESPQNGPAGGSYLMAGYDFPSGIQLVDWIWQPLGEARSPKGVEMLISSSILSTDPLSGAGPYIDWHPTPDEDAANAATLAWAMIAIQAKYVLRKPIERGMGFQNFIERLIAHGAGRPVEEITFGDSESISEGTEKLSRLQAMARELERLASKQAGPSDSVGRFLSTAQRVLSR